MTEAKVDVDDLIARVRAMIAGGEYESNHQLSMRYNVSTARIGQILRKKLEPDERKKKRRVKWTKKPKTRTRTGAYISEKNRRILRAVRRRLRADKPVRPSRMYKRLRCSEHDIITACSRHLSADEKLKMASRQCVGRKKNVAKERGD